MFSAARDPRSKLQKFKIANQIWWPEFKHFTNLTVFCLQGFFWTPSPSLRSKCKFQNDRPNMWAKILVFHESNNILPIRIFLAVEPKSQDKITKFDSTKILIFRKSNSFSPMVLFWGAESESEVKVTKFKMAEPIFQSEFQCFTTPIVFYQ